MEGPLDPGPPTHSVTGTVLLAVPILPLPAAIGPTTTVLVLLVFAIICLIVVRRWAISRIAARGGGAKAPPDDLERATPLPGTAFKVELARPLIRRAIEALGP